MSQDNGAQLSLAQRVNSYLRTEDPEKQVFAVKDNAAEIHAEEYLLQRAEEQLRAAQIRVDRLRERVHAKRGGTRQA